MTKNYTTERAGQKHHREYHDQRSPASQYPAVSSSFQTMRLLDGFVPRIKKPARRPGFFTSLFQIIHRPGRAVNFLLVYTL
jgi:hypothetical protein